MHTTRETKARKKEILYIKPDSHPEHGIGKREKGSECERASGGVGAALFRGEGLYCVRLRGTSHQFLFRLQMCRFMNPSPVPVAAFPTFVSIQSSSPIVPMLLLLYCIFLFLEILFPPPHLPLIPQSFFVPVLCVFSVYVVSISQLYWCIHFFFPFKKHVCVNFLCQ